MNLIQNMCPEITILKSLPHLPGLINIDAMYKGNIKRDWGINRLIHRKTHHTLYSQVEQITDIFLMAFWNHYGLLIMRNFALMLQWNLKQIQMGCFRRIHLMAWHCRQKAIILIHKRVEMHGCVIKTVAATALVLKHQAIRAPSQYKDRLIYVWRFPC